MAVPKRFEVKQGLPTEEECWKGFWTRLAAAWASMPPDLQRQCIAEVELTKADTRRRADRVSGKPRP
jgi:hypothetical protein